MGKSSTRNVAAEQEFSKLEHLLEQTADEIASCLKVLKTNLAEYDSRNGLLFANTSKSFMRSDIRAAKDVASELRHVADQISKSDAPSEWEITATRSKINAVFDALGQLKKTARAYDRKDKSKGIAGILGNALTGNNDSASDTVEAVVKRTLHDNFKGFSALKHQVLVAEESLSPSFAERVMDTVSSMTSSLKGEAEFAPEGIAKKSMSV
ncbi:hypothetical protein PHYSODRAFT_498700 [Phytophthora sojae]|uniref:Uncharacterized protein n=1 Tax=Phytophthora sojae (strain P6497) TaxID=1094619 RepID=G4ZHY7_PHYSP|nr:hypothetical protein PHYSODRAFT_498700 [Phytophthora sojae]EGZ17210.1 hypothetical protein PHYSODRAFT_498700 [Phytophthora sojae]|eukprot:XP_009526268.1 hypothetical protein PHYSODRAFT_498700 [Phytophthora sojae]